MWICMCRYVYTFVCVFIGERRIYFYNIMFQQRFNELFESVKFNVPSTLSTTSRLICTTWRSNDYIKYLNKTDTKTTNTYDSTFIIEAISYNSAYDFRCWCMEMREYSFYIELGRPRLSEDLCDKICRSMKPEFMNAVEDMLMDYYVLFHPNGDMYNVDDYPNLMKAVGYFIRFPIAYFNDSFTNDELMEMLSVFNRRTIVIHDRHIVRVYRLNDISNTDNRSFNVMLTEDTPWMMLKLCGALLSHNVVMYNDFISELNKLTYNDKNELYNILM